MVTLTYPGNWEELAANGPAVAKQFRAFQERWYRRWGERTRGVWIREFQTRGTPHFHMYVGLPEGLDDDEYKALVRRTIRRKQAERTKGKFEARRTAGYLDGPFGRWLLRAWNEIVKGGRYHAKRGADVAPMFWGGTVQEAEAGRVNWAKISNYLWRESGKWGQKTAPDGFVPAGRSWGMLVVRPGRARPSWRRRWRWRSAGCCGGSTGARRSETRSGRARGSRSGSPAEAETGWSCSAWSARCRGGSSCGQRRRLHGRRKRGHSGRF